MKSLKATAHELSRPVVQLQILRESNEAHPLFDAKLSELNLTPLQPTALELLQVNVGKMCNQTCGHCHVDAGPDRDEIMTRQVMRDCLSALKASRIQTVDLTGGAPEMNPDFRWFVEQIAALGHQIIVRSNLTILTVNRRYRQLPSFFAEHGLTVVSSLPCYTADNTNSQRGDGVFEKSIEGLRMLNAEGYGHSGSGLELNLVYNPLGPALPPPQQALEADYKRVLEQEFGIVFNRLYCITNMPINRFLDFLRQQRRYEQYMATLVEAFNPAAVEGLMCRNTLSVGWDGQLYDCDFNQMLELPVDPSAPRHIRDFSTRALTDRPIIVNQHCYGCTAGAGSSCGGEIL